MKKTLLNPLLHAPSLARLMTTAGLVLTIATVIGVAIAPRSDAAYAYSGSSQQYMDSTAASGSSAQQAAQPTPNTSNSTAPARTTQTTAASSSTPSPTSIAKTPSNSPTPNSVPSVSPSSPKAWKYPLHTNIKTTYFWAGEAASADNDFIQNVSSAWQENWQAHFGGSDSPTSRCGYNPCGFSPRENPFYFALPFSDFTSSGPVADLSMVHWYTAASRSQLNAGQSILKNRWIQITAAPGGTSKTVYAQWQDVGPFVEHDTNYVFGTATPTSTRAGLDVSPAVRDYLGMGGSTTSSWRFVDISEVPAGPWKNIITTSGPDWD